VKVVFPTSAGDIVSVVEFAQANMVELSVKNTGHHYAGASGKKDTLLVNMRDFKKYSSEGIVDCSSVAVDDSDNACKYAIGRNVPGYIRVGGGEVFTDLYSSVRAYNEAQEGGFKFHAIGGASSTVSPQGWTYQGGLPGTVGGRRYGFGVDQILQIEAILPSGLHVLFGPTEWEDLEGYHYPKVTKVSGHCNSQPLESDESKWIWETCSESINFEDLWFAFSGGGGGTYGIVSSIYLQLHEYPGKTVQFAYTPATMLQTCGEAHVPLEYFDLEMDLDYYIWHFMLDFLHNPSVLGVSEEHSNACAGPNDGFLNCVGEEAGTTFAEAWTSYFSNLVDNTNGIEQLISPCLEGEYLDWMEFLVTKNLVSEGENAGIIQDFPLPGYMPSKWFGVLIPKKWMMENKDKVITLIGMSPTPPYLAFGGVTGNAQDTSVTSLSRAHREAGFMVPIFFMNEYVWEMLNEMYDFSDSTNTPAYIGGNHYPHDVFGPLKSDTTMLCNTFEWTFEEADELCVSVQTTVWGTENLVRLEAIKKEIDPNGLFDCQTCVGNSRFSAQSDDGMTPDESWGTTSPSAPFPSSGPPPSVPTAEFTVAPIPSSPPMAPISSSTTSSSSFVIIIYTSLNILFSVVSCMI
jgi:FAD/FMN-containing dehydrogenase